VEKKDELNLGRKPTRNSQLKWRKEESEKGDCFLVFNPETEQLHTLRPLGIKILELCDGNHSIEQIIHQLSIDGLLEGKDAEPEIGNFLNELQKRRMISI